MTKSELIKKYDHLFWYHRKSKLHQISDIVLVEFILNYGDLQAVKDLIKYHGINRTAEIFFNSIKSERNNYQAQVKNYFYHYFRRYAS